MTLNWRGATGSCHVSTHMTDEPARLSYAEFQRVDIRVGRVVAVEEFPEARTPAYKLRIDFGGEIGVKKSSAQATRHYSKDALLNRLVVAVVNFPPKQIGPYMSEVLTLGVPDGDGGVVLLVPERDVPLNGRMF
jgi:tRNA-binding protein